MSFDWKDYVYLAEDLLTRAEESYLQSSISRAYYGVFCIARNKKSYKVYQGPDVHRQVITAFKNSVNKNEQNIGQILDNLRRSRNIADYNEDKLINKILAKRIVIKAKVILSSLGV